MHNISCYYYILHHVTKQIFKITNKQKELVEITTSSFLDNVKKGGKTIS